MVENAFVVASSTRFRQEVEVKNMWQFLAKHVNMRLTQHLHMCVSACRILRIQYHQSESRGLIYLQTAECTVVEKY
jgi:hypothetical protein